jgi:hypothetical protein
MARPTLMTHRKFGRFARAMGSPALARGILEMLWDGCYESGEDYLGTAADIDQRIGWTGEAGLVARELVACGQPEGHGFIEAIPNGSATTYRVHDLWHHAPDYVQKRRQREMNRRQKVDPDAERRRTAPFGEHCPATPACQIEVDRTPAPARAPAPALKSVSSATDEPSPEPAILTFPAVGKVKAWDLTEPQIAKWRTLYPNLDVLAECRKALAWCDSHPQKRKTARGMPGFLVSWFSRAVDRGGGAARGGAVSEMPFTRDELDRARQVQRATVGGCPHDPRCEDRDFCRGKLIKHWREQQRQGAA